MRMTLQRVSVIREGAFGVLVNERGVPFAVTLERTYDELDETGHTATKIPPGIYRAVRDWYHKGGYRTYEIVVPNHSRILFHKGNVETDADGCVLVGESFGELRETPAILDSSRGFLDFMLETRNIPEFELVVKQ